MSMNNEKKIIRHVPNALTLARLVMSLVFIGLVLYAPKTGLEKPARLLTAAFVLFVIAALTDIVDGKIARKYDVTSKFGRLVDPLADKILVCGAFICFALLKQPRLANLGLSETTLHIIRWGTAGVLLMRETAVQSIRHLAESRGVEFGAVWSGKIKMFVQSFGIGTVIIGWAYVSRPWGDWFTIITYTIVVWVTALSGIQYLRRPFRPPAES